MKPTTTNNGINTIKELRNLFNEIKINIVREERDRIREILYKKGVVYNFLKNKEHEGSLTNKEEKVLKKISRKLKNFKKYSVKLRKKLFNITYGLNIYLMKSIKMNTTNQEKSRVLLMVVIHYMKAEGIKILN